MKKSLLIVAAMTMSMGAFAQESAFVDTETLFAGMDETVVGQDSKGNDVKGYNLAAGAVLCKSENVEMVTPYDNIGYKATALAGEADNAKAVNIGGTEYKATTGVQGQMNPSPAPTLTSCPTAGAVIQFNVKKDGFLYAICKLSSNKQYYVWEGAAVSNPPVMAYTYTQHLLKAAADGSMDINYTLPADADGYFTAAQDPDQKYCDGTGLRWPEKIAFGATSADQKINGLGIISFPVYADAGIYLLHAQGSKVTIDGFVFSETQLDASVVTETAGINGVVADKAEAASVKKFVENGKVVIVKAGKKFNVAGAQLK